MYFRINIFLNLLTDTEDLYTVAFQNILTPFGHEYTFDFKLQLMGSHASETADRIIANFNLPYTREEFMKETEKQFNVLFPDAEVLPGKIYTIYVMYLYFTRYRFQLCMGRKIVYQFSRGTSILLVSSMIFSMLRNYVIKCC